MVQSVCLTIAPGEGRPPLQDEVYIRLIHDLHAPPPKRFASMTSAHGFVFMLAGEGRLWMDGRRHHLRTDGCLRYAPGMSIDWEGGRGVHMLRCTVKGARAGAMLDAVGLAPNEPVQAPSSLGRRLASEVTRMRSQGAGTWDAVALAWVFLAAWAAPASAADDPVDACVELMRERFGEGLAIDELARELGVDRSTLFRRFRRRYGCSPKRWLDEHRLERAAELLRESALPVTEVAGVCGFGDAAWFGRRFRERYGCAPGSWRSSPRR